MYRRGGGNKRGNIIKKKNPSYFFLNRGGRTTDPGFLANTDIEMQVSFVIPCRGESFY